MKFLKNLLVISSILVFLVSATSCKKCIICIIKNLAGDSTVFISPEQCGNTSKLDAYKKSLQDGYFCQTCWKRDSLNALNDTLATTLALFPKTGREICGRAGQLDSIKNEQLVLVILYRGGDITRKDTLICSKTAVVSVNCDN